MLHLWFFLCQLNFLVGGSYGLEAARARDASQPPQNDQILQNGGVLSIQGGQLQSGLRSGRRLSQDGYSYLALDETYPVYSQESSGYYMQYPGSAQVPKSFQQSFDQPAPSEVTLAVGSSSYTGTGASQGSSQALIDYDAFFWRVQSQESIIYTDDRLPVYNTSVFPYRTIGILQSTCKYRPSICTGTLVGPGAVLTSGHCIFQDGEYCREFKFTPGLWDGSRGAPKRTITASQFYVPQKFEELSTESYYDVGVVILDEQVGYEVGWMGIGYDCLQSNQDLITAGYPFQQSSGVFNEMFETECQAQSVQACPCFAFPVGSCILQEGYMIQHTCDTESGQSGSPLWTYINMPSYPQIRALHSKGFRCDPNEDPLSCDQTNKATAIGPEIYDWILSKI